MGSSPPRKRPKVHSQITQDFIDELPVEILLRILHFLDLRDILSLMQVGGLIQEEYIQTHNYSTDPEFLPKETAIIRVYEFEEVSASFTETLRDPTIKIIVFDGANKNPGRDVLSWIQSAIKSCKEFNPKITLFIVRNVHEVYINSRQLDKGFTADNIVLENVQKLSVDYWTGSTISFIRPFILELKELEINIGTRHFNNLDLFDWEKSNIGGVSIYSDFDEPQVGFRRESRVLPVPDNLFELDINDDDENESAIEPDDHYRIDSDDTENSYHNVPPTLLIQNTTWNMEYLNIRWAFPSVKVFNLNFPNLINLDIEITDTLSVNKAAVSFKSLTAKKLKSFVLKNYGSMSTGLFHGVFDFGETLDYLCIEGSVFDYVGLNEFELYQDQVCTPSFDTSFFNKVKKFYKVPGVRLWNEEIDVKKVTFAQLEELCTRAMVDEFNVSKVFTTFHHERLKILKMEYFYVFDNKDPINTIVNFTINAPNLKELEIHGAYSSDVEKFPKFKIDFTKMKPFPKLEKLLLTGFCTDLKPFKLDKLKELHVRDVHDVNCKQEKFTISVDLPEIETITLDYSIQLSDEFEFKTNVFMKDYQLKKFKHNQGCNIYKMHY